MNVKLNTLLLTGKKTHHSLTQRTITIENNHMVKYLSCCFDANLSEESIAMNSLRKISTKLTVLP